jgi:hypothetical protein
MTSTLLQRITGTISASLLLVGMASAQGDCLNVDQFPFSAAVPNADGTVTTISTCVFPQEYSVITGILPGASYAFTISGGGYITLRSGTFDGPVVAQGFGLVEYTAVDASDLFAHYTVDDFCNQGTGCRDNTVQLLLDCTPPTVAFNIRFDCDNLAYYIDVNVSDLGDAVTVDIENDGGAPAFTGVGVGIYETGPYANLQAVQIFVRHSEDVLCSVLSPSIVNSPCPVVSCGPDSYTYCYGNLESTVFSFQGDSGFPLAVSFTGGEFNQFGNDIVTIHDGTDDLAPIIFSGNNGGDMTGLLVISNNPDNALTFVLQTDFGTSCQDQGLAPLEWDVQCLTCTLPVADFSVITDCEAFEFFVEVDLTALGTNPSILITNNGGAPELVVDAPGTYQVGPFTAGIPVTVVLVDDGDALCNRTSPSLVNPLCPMPITCGAPAVEETYCYGPNEVQAWSYVSDGGGSLRLKFLRGTIESNTWDRLRIFDGSDNSGDILFEHSTFQTYNLGPTGSAINNFSGNYYGVDVFATGNELYMELISDGVVQCDGGFDFDAWEWEVVCLDCTLPVAGAAIEEDCDAGLFSIPITVASTGDGATVDIVYTVNGGAAQTIAGVGVGQTVLGPFQQDDVVNVVVQHESNILCNVDLGNLTDSGTCPTVIICGDDLLVEHCPGNNEDTFFYYQGSGSFPLGIQFTAGDLEDCCDRLFVYDGSGETAPELTPAFGVGGPVAGLFYLATNPDNILTVRVVNDGFGSCQDGSNETLAWTLACLDCVPPQVSYELVTDCPNLQYSVDVIITSLGSDDEMELTYDNGAQSISITAPGTYQIGPFATGTSSQFTLVNDANSLCNYSSPVLLDPLCPTNICGATVLEETHCYTAFDYTAWSYELPGAGTLRLTFLRGTLESSFYDGLTIYDGPDNTSPVLFQHLNTGFWNLGPEGSSINNTFPDFYAVDVTATGSNLYMEMYSDGSVQCFGSTEFDQWEWIVFCDGCAIPGVTYNAVPDCNARNYVMEVDVADAGPDGLRVVNTFTGEEQVATTPGTLSFGPFAQNAPVAFELTALDNPVCSYFSDTLTYASVDCIIVSCGVDNYSHCYGNNEDRWYTFQSAINVPTTITFLQGQMLAGDRIVVYNGRDENAPVIFQGNNGGNLSGFAANSQNVNNAITLRIQSNSTGSCQDGGVTTELRWDVACGAVGIDELGDGAFAVYPNPTAGLLYIQTSKETTDNVALRIFDISGQVVLQQQLAGQNGLNTVDMQGLISGHYLVQLATAGWVKTQRVELVR